MLQIRLPPTHLTKVLNQQNDSSNQDNDIMISRHIRKLICTQNKEYVTKVLNQQYDKIQQKINMYTE